MSTGAIKKLNNAKFKEASLARGLKPTSLNVYLRHIRGALNTAVEWEYMKRGPKVKKWEVEEPDRQPRTLTKDEITALLKEAKENDFEMWRVIGFALWIGARRKGIHGARWQSVEENYIRLREKGSKERTIPIPKEARIYIGKTKDVGYIFDQCHIDNYSKRFRAIADAVGQEMGKLRF